MNTVPADNRDEQRHPLYTFAGCIVLWSSIYAVVIWSGLIPLIAQLLVQALQGDDALLTLATLLRESFIETPLLTHLYAATLALLFTYHAILWWRIFSTYSPSSVLRLTGLGGGVASLFGIGCMACGYPAFLTLFGIAGAGFITALPFRGNEIAGVGLILLAFSAWQLRRSVTERKT